MNTTPIEWTGMTWNPTTGCDRISPGCDHCYALTLAKRLNAMGSAKYQNDGHPLTSGPGFAVTTHPDTLLAPIHWRRPRIVFVNSMSDLAHARIPPEFLAQVFAVIALTGQHTYQILTKRPRRLRELLTGTRLRDMVYDALTRMRRHAAVEWSNQQARLLDSPAARTRWPLPNVWIGTSIESDTYTWRADELRETPAATRFLSLEPLLGPLPSLDLTDIDWVIAGGESGPHHRPTKPDWVREIRDRCTQHDIPFFFKQWGGRTPKTGGRLLDGRTWNDMPAAATL